MDAQKFLGHDSAETAYWKHLQHQSRDVYENYENWAGNPNLEVSPHLKFSPQVNFTPKLVAEFAPPYGGHGNRYSPEDLLYRAQVKLKLQATLNEAVKELHYLKLQLEARKASRNNRQENPPPINDRDGCNCCHSNSGTPKNGNQEKEPRSEVPKPPKLPPNQNEKIEVAESADGNSREVERTVIRPVIAPKPMPRASTNFIREIESFNKRSLRRVSKKKPEQPKDPLEVAIKNRLKAFSGTDEKNDASNGEWSDDEVD